jgi:type VI secretion system protein ImpJ
MKTSRPVVWSEGLLLTPQHLQQQTLYHQEMTRARLDALERLNWGVLELEINARELLGLQVRLSRFSGVFPDGLVLDLETGDPELPPSRPVNGHFPAGQAALEIFLAIPRENPNGENYSKTGENPLRFSIDRRSVRDMAGGGQDADVSFGRHNLFILFGDEPREDFISIKIAELVRDDTGALLVSEPYIPPCLRISASPFIAAGLKRIYSLMSNRYKSLAEARRQTSLSTIEFTAVDVTRFLLLSTIGGFIPIVKHLIDQPDVSPRDAYLLLSQFGGQLATFSVDVDPGNIASFSYTDLRSTFETLFARLIYMLQATVQEHCITLALQAREDGMHVGQFQEGDMARCAAFFLAVRGEMPEQQVGTQLPRLSKIASWADVNNILNAATPGAAVEATFRPPPEIAIKAGWVYFAIATQNSYWRNIIKNRNIAVYLPLMFNPAKTQVQLLGIPPRSDAPGVSLHPRSN